MSEFLIILLAGASGGLLALLLVGILYLLILGIRTIFWRKP